MAPPARSTIGTRARLGAGSHLLTGGLGGLGLLMARLLGEGGARHIVLSSRSGRVVEGSESDWGWLAERGDDTLCVRSDVSELGAVLEVLEVVLFDVGLLLALRLLLLPLQHPLLPPLLGSPTPHYLGVSTTVVGHK